MSEKVEIFRNKKRNSGTSVGIVQKYIKKRLKIKF